MSDFDRMLERALRPVSRPADHCFAERVALRVALDERFRAERAAGLRTLAVNLVTSAALAAAMWVALRSPAFDGWSAESPGGLLAALLLAFSLWVALISNGAVAKNRKSLFSAT